MSDLISRQALLNDVEELKQSPWFNDDNYFAIRKDALCCVVDLCIKKAPSAQPEDWMERNKERILQAGMEGREIEFRIGGRLFAIREKAQ